jgi:hypothetical protein
MQGDMDHELHCVKTESDSGTNMDNTMDNVRECGGDTHMDGDTDHELYCIKTDSGSDTTMVGDMDHELYCIKTKSGSDTTIADFNNPTETVTISSVLYIESEPQDDVLMKYCPQNTCNFSQSKSDNAESVPTVLERAGGMYMVNDGTQISLQMCNDELTQSDNTHTIFKHEHTYCEDDTYPSVSPEWRRVQRYW